MDNPKTIMGTDYLIRVDFTLDDWTWLCHTLRDASHLGAGCCQADIDEVLGVIEQGQAIQNDL